MKRSITVLVVCALAPLLFPRRASARDPDFQPLAAQATRLVETLDSLGSPLAPEDRKALLDATTSADPSKAVPEIQRVLDKYCLLLVSINPESRVKVARGAAAAELVQD